jgi:hypothetical protein
MLPPFAGNAAAGRGDARRGGTGLAPGPKTLPPPELEAPGAGRMVAERLGIKRYFFADVPPSGQPRLFF